MSEMRKGRLWFDRSFKLGLSGEEFPSILERVRGTPARLEDRLAGLSPEALTHQVEDAWSIQENVGHLGDLEPLWAGRLEELMAGRKELRPADLENRKTQHAGHNERFMKELLHVFRRQRMEIVAQLEALTPAQVELTALHPRLQQPMSVVDLFYFVAEHDDHHLARISTLIRSLRSEA